MGKKGLLTEGIDLLVGGKDKATVGPEGLGDYQKPGLHSQKQKHRAAAMARLKSGVDASDRNVKRIRGAGAQEISGFDRNTAQTQATMRGEAARSLAASQGRGMRQNVGSTLDQGLASGQMSAQFSSERDAQRSQMAAAHAMQLGQAEQAAADYGLQAVEKEMSIGTEEGERSEKMSFYKNAEIQWEADAEASGMVVDTYVQQKIVAAMASETNPEVLKMLEDMYWTYA